MRLKGKREPEEGERTGGKGRGTFQRENCKSQESVRPRRGDGGLLFKK